MVQCGSQPSAASSPSCGCALLPSPLWGWRGTTGAYQVGLWWQSQVVSDFPMERAESESEALALLGLVLCPLLGHSLRRGRVFLKFLLWHLGTSQAGTYPCSNRSRHFHTMIHRSDMTFSKSQISLAMIQRPGYGTVVLWETGIYSLGYRRRQGPSRWFMMAVIKRGRLGSGAGPTQAQSGCVTSCQTL